MVKTIDDLIQESWDRMRFEAMAGSGFDSIISELLCLRRENAKLRELLGGEIVLDLV
jgi:hypothetical protein